MIGLREGEASVKERAYTLIDMFASRIALASLAKETLASPRTMEFSTNSIMLEQKQSQFALIKSQRAPRVGIPEKFLNTKSSEHLCPVWRRPTSLGCSNV